MGLEGALEWLAGRREQRRDRRAPSSTERKHTGHPIGHRKLTPGSGERSQLFERVMDGLYGEVHHDALPNPDTELIGTKPRAREAIGKPLLLEIHSHIANIRRRSPTLYTALLVLLSGRVIDLEHGRVLQRREPPSARIEPRSENDELVDPRPQRSGEVDIDRLGSENHVVDEPERRRAHGVAVETRSATKGARGIRKTRQPGRQ